MIGFKMVCLAEGSAALGWLCYCSGMVVGALLASVARLVGDRL